MNRRHFLRLLTASGVTAGVAASAGFELSHFLSWLTRKPRWSFPTDLHPISTLKTHVIPADEMLAEFGPTLGQLTTIYYDRKALDLFEARALLFPDNTKAMRFGNIYKPVLETKHGLVVV